MKPQNLGLLRYMAPAGLFPHGLAWVWPSRFPPEIGYRSCTFPYYHKADVTSKTLELLRHDDSSRRMPAVAKQLHLIRRLLCSGHQTKLSGHQTPVVHILVGEMTSNWRPRKPAASPSTSRGG